MSVRLKIEDAGEVSVRITRGAYVGCWALVKAGISINSPASGADLSSQAARAGLATYKLTLGVGEYRTGSGSDWVLAIKLDFTRSD